jgi:hypothetical protein
MARESHTLKNLRRGTDTNEQHTCEWIKTNASDDGSELLANAITHTHRNLEMVMPIPKKRHTRDLNAVWYCATGAKEKTISLTLRSLEPYYRKTVVRAVRQYTTRNYIVKWRASKVEASTALVLQDAQKNYLVSLSLPHETSRHTQAKCDTRSERVQIRELYS